MSQCHLRQALVITERFMFSWLMKCVFKLFFWIQSPCSLYGNGGFWWENWFCEVDKNIRRWHLIVQRFILFKFYVFGHIFEPIEMLLYSLQMSRSFCFSKWGWYDFNWWSKLLRNINHTDNQPEAWDQKTHFRHDGCFEKIRYLLVEKSKQQKMETLWLQCVYNKQGTVWTRDPWTYRMATRLLNTFQLKDLKFFFGYILPI